MTQEPPIREEPPRKGPAPDFKDSAEREPSPLELPGDRAASSSTLLAQGFKYSAISFVKEFAQQGQRRRWRKPGLILLFLLFVWWFIPPVWKLTSGPVTVTHWEKVKGETVAIVGFKMPGWIPAKSISRHVLHAFVAAEDGRFYEHNGLDFSEIRSSFATNWKKKRYARGGSTITQQVVKVAFLDRNKSMIRKAREATGALLLELILPKDRILEWYINLVEFGDGVYGIKQGCWHYFRTKPELLTIEQAIHLALVLPSPNAWSLGLKRKSLTNFGHKRFASILNRMRGAGYVTKSQWAEALARGDFGRPIHGYSRYLEAQKKNTPICPGSPGCPDEQDDDEIFDEESDSLSFPRAGTGVVKTSDSPVTTMPINPEVNAIDTGVQPEVSTVPTPAQPAHEKVDEPAIAVPQTDADWELPQ